MLQNFIKLLLKKTQYQSFLVLIESVKNKNRPILERKGRYLQLIYNLDATKYNRYL